jgi:hypothetical protein
MQKTTVEHMPATSEIAVSIKGNFSWKIGEKTQEEDEIKKTFDEAARKKKEEEEKTLPEDESEDGEFKQV